MPVNHVVRSTQNTLVYRKVSWSTAHGSSNVVVRESGALRNSQMHPYRHSRSTLLCQQKIVLYECNFTKGYDMNTPRKSFTRTQMFVYKGNMFYAWLNVQRPQQSHLSTRQSSCWTVTWVSIPLHNQSVSLSRREYCLSVPVSTWRATCCTTLTFQKLFCGSCF